MSAAQPSAELLERCLKKFVPLLEEPSAQAGGTPAGRVHNPAGIPSEAGGSGV